MHTTTPLPLVIRKRDLATVVGLSSRQCERMEAAGRFPARIQISARSVGWLYADLVQWAADRSASRDGAR